MVRNRQHSEQPSTQNLDKKMLFPYTKNQTNESHQQMQLQCIPAMVRIWAATNTRYAEKKKLPISFYNPIRKTLLWISCKKIWYTWYLEYLGHYSERVSDSFQPPGGFNVHWQHTACEHIALHLRRNVATTPLGLAVKCLNSWAPMVGILQENDPWIMPLEGPS